MDHGPTTGLHGFAALVTTVWCRAAARMAGEGDGPGHDDDVERLLALTRQVAFPDPHRKAE